MLTEHILALQRQHVPHRSYTPKPTDRLWFSYRCHLAAKRKYSTQLHYKRNPSRKNKNLHRVACKQMQATRRWAKRRSEAYLRTNLSGLGVGSKTWWTLVKERQGSNHQETIPPLFRPDRTCAISSRENAELLPEYFAAMITDEDPRKPPPRLKQEAAQMVTAAEVTREKVERLPRGCRRQEGHRTR